MLLTALSFTLFLSLAFSQIHEQVSVSLIKQSKQLTLDHIYDKVTSQYDQDAVLALAFNGKKFIVDLELASSFLHQDFKHVNVDQNGVETEISHDLNDHCAYHGTVRGNALGRALFIVCGGRLRGTMQIGYKSFNFLLVDGVTVVESGVSQTKTLPVESVPLPSNLQEVPVSINSRRSTTQSTQTDRGEISVALYIQPSLVSLIKKWKWSVADFARITVTRTNFLYNKIGLQVRLIAIKETPETFKKQHASASLEDFTNSIKAVQNLPEDFSFLMVGYSIFSDQSLNREIAGVAWVGSMCLPGSATGFAAPIQNIPLDWGHLLSHEMGHSIGAGDDYSRREQCCPSTLCVMDISGNDNETWSDCTAKEIAQFFSTAKTCLTPNNCAYAEWSKWSDRCTGGFQTRRRATTSGVCDSFVEFRPAPVCATPQPPRGGIFYATPNRIQLWACDPNVDWMVRVRVLDSSGRLIGGSQWADNFEGVETWMGECIWGMQHTYEIDLQPAPAVGSKLTVTIFGIDGNKNPDNMNINITTNVSFTCPRPPRWCNNTNYVPVDCDGDGIPNEICVDKAGRYQVILPTPGNKCIERSSPQKNSTLCPPLFKPARATSDEGERLLLVGDGIPLPSNNANSGVTNTDPAPIPTLSPGVIVAIVVGVVVVVVVVGAVGFYFAKRSNNKPDDGYTRA